MDLILHSIPTYNGNMIKDLDRNIVTIKYNLLNLPEIIQFKNGNQIRNLYDASGQKLRTREITVSNPIEPITENSIYYISQGDEVYESGTDYIGNVEYDYYGEYYDGMISSEYLYIGKIQNSEGYVDFPDPDFMEDVYRYNYFRKDHLGNIREVWSAAWNYFDTSFPATTAQRTHYYPSGLPWRTTTGIGAEYQKLKYNGKEFVEMHGLDEYDSEARWYYPAIMRTTTMDPLAEKYYSISPYAWCGGNPVRMVDPTGMDWYSYEEKYKDKDGKEQTRTAYKYVEGQMSEKEMSEGGYTHLGLTYTNGNDYYSLFGSKKDLKTKEGMLYKKLDEAIINYAEAKIYNKNIKQNGLYDSENHDRNGLTNFTIKNITGVVDFNYEGSYWGVYHNFTGKDMNNATMENWIGDSNMPMDIGSYGHSNQKMNSNAYHIRFQNSRRGDPVHLKYNRSAALVLLRKYYNLFPHLKKK
jgi:RHS repeat-associated protein